MGDYGASHASLIEAKKKQSNIQGYQGLKQSHNVDTFLHRGKVSPPVSTLVHPNPKLA